MPLALKQMMKRSPHRDKPYVQLKRSGRLRAGKPMKHGTKRLRAKIDPKLITWSKAVRDRDNNECQWPQAKCLNRGTLHAHHIATRSRRPDLIYDEDNGITLCFLHHQWVHDHPIEAEAIGLLSSETYESAMKNSHD